MSSLLTISTPARFTAEVRGRRALSILKKSGVPHLFNHRPPSGGAPCWTCPAQRVADVLAAAETTRGIRVVIEHEQEALPL